MKLFFGKSDESKLEMLRNLPRFTPGKVKIYNWKLKYLDAPSLGSSIDVLVCKKWNDFMSDNNKPVILDCGANVGVSVLNYKKQYPNAKIIAFEADPNIVPVLHTNLDKNNAKDVQVINSAVWIKNEMVDFFCEGADGGRILDSAVPSNSRYKINAVDICEYINQPIDLIKMDIEGAEYDVVHHMLGKMSLVKNMVIECHMYIDEMSKFALLLSDLAESGFFVSVNTYGKWIDLLHKTSNVDKASKNGGLQFDQYALVAAWR